ncbi:MAG: SdpI family protein [Bacteroidota bacterium]|nr:SdpI family protein [Bacteroidota bacterium]MDX5430897.1 SdpI family protein [Bacteroidota bacterium]MDX5469644.1 SdpI family protein [Bacteroidota bacterium]
MTNKGGVLKLSPAKELVIWFPLVVPYLFYFVWKDRLPERVPSHYGINGEADAFMAPFELLIFMTVIGVFVSALLMAAPFIDPKKSNYLYFEGFYFFIRLFMTLLLSSIVIMSMAIGLGYSIPVDRIISVAVLGLMLVLGNYMTKVRTNFFVGIRTPWTLSNEEVWRKTHRLAGRLLVSTSLLSLAVLFFLPSSTFVFLLFGTIGIGLIYPTIRSYFWYKSMK